MRDLIARLEKLSGTDGETDADIWMIVDRASAQRCFWNATPGIPTRLIPGEKLPLGLGRNAVINNAPRYTISVDAARSLLPWKDHPGATFTSKTIKSGLEFYHFAEFTWPSTERQGRANTEALATCICALLAIEETERQLAPYSKGHRNG